MKRIHLLAVRQGASPFAPLVTAAAAAGMRVGWLEMRAPDKVPKSLDEALESGARRAVAVGEDRVVAAKALRGAAAVRDLLREHFLGCRLVLVHGAEDLPVLETDGKLWRVRAESESVMSFTLQEIVTALRKPHPPWASRETV